MQILFITAAQPTSSGELDYSSHIRKTGTLQVGASTLPSPLHKIVKKRNIKPNKISSCTFLIILIYLKVGMNPYSFSHSFIFWNFVLKYFFSSN